ncbi:hypothetical protein N9917_01580 [Deltaproteobacteria bacterium]|nr:hypothetical protein [Deltaproteobacteria bacterium]
MKVGKAKMGFKARKDTDGEAGCFHRGKGGRRARKVRKARKAIETRVRQQGRRECREGV